MRFRPRPITIYNMAIDTLFQPNGGGGGSGSGGGDYIKDVFDDVSREPSNNSGLTSSASTNPLGVLLNDTDSAQYGIRTLHVKGLELLADRTKWVSGKATYRILFHETCPYVYGYAYGNVRLLQRGTATHIAVFGVDDGVAITGIIRQVGWVVNPNSASTASATPLTDGAAGSALNFNSQAPLAEENGVDKYAVLLHNSALETENIHDYRLEADQTGLLEVSAIVVYSQNSNSTLEQRPGSSYVDKALVTTLTGASFALPNPTGRLGGRSVVQKLATGVYGVTTSAPNSIESIGIGSINTNLIDVTTGQGGSFPIGSVIGAITAGSSNYFGVVTNQSTDTLTVGPTLAFGLSGTLYKFAEAGPTFAINASLYTLRQKVDLFDLYNSQAPDGVGFGTTTPLYFSDPSRKWRVWGRDLGQNIVNATPGIQFVGNTQAFLQIDGDMSSLEVELSGAGIIHGTFALNGVPVWGLNEGFTGVAKKTVFANGGKAWQSVVFTPGTSHGNVVFSSLNIYDTNKPIGVSFGALSQFDTFVDTLDRGTTQNATLFQVGRLQRLYADDLYVQGSWGRGLASTYAGGVAMFGASTNSKLIAKYYGTDFAVLGTAGGSMSCTFDGASISAAFNSLNKVGTSLAWHTVEMDYEAGNTAIITAFDYIRGDQQEVASIQNYNSDQRLPLVPDVYMQNETPQQAKDGDIWITQKPNQRSLLPSIYIKLALLWHKIAIEVSTDDPNLNQILSFGGGTTDTNSSQTAVAEAFNGGAWTTVNSMTTSIGNSGGGIASYRGAAHNVDRWNTTTAALTHQRFFNGIWSNLTTRATARQGHGDVEFFGFFLVSQGSTDDGAGGAGNVCDSWNGNAWAAQTAWAVDRVFPGVFYHRLTNLVSAAGGQSSGGTRQTPHYVKNTAFANTLSTATPTAGGSYASGATPQGNGMLAFWDTDATADTNSYEWNGSAWSAAKSVTYSSTDIDSCGMGSVNNLLVCQKGFNVAVLATTSYYNGAAWSAGLAGALARCSGQAGNIQ